MSTNQQKMMVWLQAQVDGYKGVFLDNFHTSWRDGLAFCALVHSLSPRCGIKYDDLSAANASDNLALAFNSAERYLGISKLLDVEDMVAGPKPEQFSVITYLGQFYKKYGATTRSLVRTTTAPQLMTQEKKQQLEALAEVRERFGIKPGIGAEVPKDDDKKERKSLQRTVSVQAIPSHAPKSASEALKESKATAEDKPKPKIANKEDLFRRCHKSGMTLHGVTPVEWNGNVYHPDKFCCTSCSQSFKGGKEIVNVSNEPYCKDCGKKAFLGKYKTGSTPTTSSSTTSLNKKIVPLEEKKAEVTEEETVVLTPLAQKSSVPQWRQKLAEKKEQLKTGQTEIENATNRLSAAKKRRDSKAEPMQDRNAAPTTSATEKTGTESNTAPPTAQGGSAEPAADEVKCGGCGKSQKKSKFCNGCGKAIVEAAPAPTSTATPPTVEKKEFENPLFAAKPTEVKKPATTTPAPTTAKPASNPKACANYKPHAFKKGTCNECYQPQSDHASSGTPTEPKLDAKAAMAAKLAEKQKQEKEKADKLAAEKLEKENAEKEKLEKEKAEKERLEKERQEKEKADKERADKERLEKEKAERDRVEKERQDSAERDRLAKESADRLEKERLDKLAAEKLAAEKLAAEKLVEQQKQEKAEKERQEKAEKERQERERQDREKAEKERQERAEQERQEKLQLEKKLAAEKAAADKLAEEQRQEKLRAEREKLSSDQLVASLRSEIEQLKAELEKTKREKDTLFTENQDLKSQLATRKSSTATPPIQSHVIEEPTVTLSFPAKPATTNTPPNSATSTTNSQLSATSQQAAQKLAAEKLAAQKMAALKADKERAEREKAEKERQEKEKQQQVSQSAQRLASERLAQEREKAEKEKLDRLAMLQQQQRQKAEANINSSATSSTAKPSNIPSSPSIPSSNSTGIPAWKQKLIDSKKGNG